MPSVHVGVTYSEIIVWHVGFTCGIVLAYEKHSSYYRGPGFVLVYHFSPRLLTSPLGRPFGRSPRCLGLLLRQGAGQALQASGGSCACRACAVGLSPALPALVSYDLHLACLAVWASRPSALSSVGSGGFSLGASPSFALVAALCLSGSPPPGLGCCPARPFGLAV